MGNKLGSTFDLAKGCGVLKGINLIDLIHDTRHLCKRLKIDGLKAMSRGFSGGGGGGNQVGKNCQCKISQSICLF